MKTLNVRTPVGRTDRYDRDADYRIKDDYLYIKRGQETIAAYPAGEWNSFFYTEEELPSLLRGKD